LDKLCETTGYVATNANDVAKISNLNQLYKILTAEQFRKATPLSDWFPKK